MSTSDITLSAPTRTNLLSLTRTSRLIGRTQERLSTGLKVNSALDDALAFFQSRGLSNRSSDLAALKNSIDQGISTVKAAVQGAEALADLVDQAKGLALQARQTNDTSERQNLANQFNVIRNQLTDLANDSSYNGTNLVGQTADNLTVTFDEDGDHKITITGTSLDATGLSIELAAGNFGSDANIDAAISDLDVAIGEVRNTSATLGSSNSLLQIRLNFTETLVNTLEEGAAKLVNADLNEESANLLSLQTRQSLGVTSLSLAQQSEQSVLQLF
tara:strand:- start:87470 stop:88291 length:822 start_codon:yes stop_codon:yes gene_type:complete